MALVFASVSLSFMSRRILMRQLVACTVNHRYSTIMPNTVATKRQSNS